MKKLVKRTVGVILAVAMVFALQMPVFAATTQYDFSKVSDVKVSIAEIEVELIIGGNQALHSFDVSGENAIIKIIAPDGYEFTSVGTPTKIALNVFVDYVFSCIKTEVVNGVIEITLDESDAQEFSTKANGSSGKVPITVTFALESDIGYKATASTPTPPTSTPDDTDTSTEKKDRDKDKDEPTGLIVEVKEDKSAPTTGLQNNDDQVADMVFDAVELRDIGNGASAAVILTIEDVSENVPVIDKILIDNSIKDLNKENTKQNMTLGMYLDISLFKEINNDRTQIHNTNGKLKIQIEIPKNLRQNGRNFAIARLHDREFEIITGTYDAKTGMFTFETDRFSTYALVYDDGGEATEVVSENVADFGVEYAVLEF